MNKKEQLKSKYYSALAEMTTGYKITKGDKAAVATTVGVGTFLMSTRSCYAADIIGNLSKKANEYYDKLVPLALGLGGLCAVIALILWLIPVSDRATETGKRWFLRILLCVAALFCLGGIFGLIKDVTAGQSLKAGQLKL